MYEKEKTALKIQDNGYVVSLIEQNFIRRKTGNAKILETRKSFKEKYEKEHLEDYQEYRTFLENNALLKPQSRLTEDDIQALRLINMNKKQIVEAERTRGQISSAFFRSGDAKYVKKHPELEKAILSILNIPFFPEEEKDKQYVCVVFCKTPKLIVLCENLDFLKMPRKAAENYVELWHVGGSNTSPLQNTPPRSEPIYYSCDWDFHGLQIFQRIKLIIPQIKLLSPVASPKCITKSKHGSQWKNDVVLSGLQKENFKDEEIDLIEQLIEKNEWIEEESNDLLDMLKFNNC